MDKKFQVKLKIIEFWDHLMKNKWNFYINKKSLIPPLCKEFPVGDWTEAYKVLASLVPKKATQISDEDDIESKKFIIPKDENVDNVQS